MINKEKIVQMRESGMTFQKIADELGCSKQYANCEYNKKKGELGRFMRRKPYNKYGKKKRRIVYPKIENYFLENRISVNGFCKNINIEYSTFSKFIAGETKNINLKTLKKFLDYTGITLYEIFGGTDCED